MNKFTTGFLLVTLLLFGQIILAKENSEHQKDITKTVSTQLLRMKLKKMGKAKANEKSLIGKASEKEKKTKPDDTIWQQSKEKSVTVTESITDTEKESISLVAEKEANKSKSKKILPNQQKNDSLRLKIQNLVNANFED
jgi:hypothetical protein